MIRVETTNRVSVGTQITTTSETTVYTAENFATVLLIHCANKTAASRTITVTWRDSSAAVTYNLLYQAPVQANAVSQLAFDTGLQIEDGDTIRVTADAGNAFDVVVSVVETTGRSG